jgi:hypothetical protein
MVTSLSHGASVPAWDRVLSPSLQRALIDQPPSATVQIVTVLNDQGEPYRTLTAADSHEYEVMLECLAELGFEIEMRADGARARLPELAAALKRLSPAHATNAGAA